MFSMKIDIYFIFQGCFEEPPGFDGSWILNLTVHRIESVEIQIGIFELTELSKRSQFGFFPNIV